MKKEMIVGAVGSVLSTASAIGETKEVLELIYIILAILGALLTFVIMPLIHWYEKAKKDGKITAEEVKDGINIAAQGIDKTLEKAQNVKKGETQTEESKK